ncbi:hypothetical protein ZIOFF_039294 [Zingiber officinale]|uniref:Methyltransferase small domain-containing protein n=1 Tax=Zingiber officinale TaxID=94328 RepID=A0A8J5G0Y7_ZINOF|nr:hypothetical protein ZIOFF_039294 [Zingiber officinale]
MFGQQSEQARHEATRKYTNARMILGTHVRDHVMPMTNYFSEAEMHGAVIDEGTQVSIILNSLSSDFIPFTSNYIMNKLNYGMTQLLNELQTFKAISGLVKNKAEANIINKPNSSKGLKRKMAKGGNLVLLSSLRELADGELTLRVGNGALVSVKVENTYGNISGKIVADFGCGCGTLGLASALLDAEQVIGIDIDPQSLEIASENAVDLELEMDFMQCDINNLRWRDHLVHTVVMNPPFGTRRKGSDVEFLAKALKVASCAVYSLHKTTTRDLRYDVPQLYKFLKKKELDIAVDLWRFVPNANQAL